MFPAFESDNNSGPRLETYFTSLFNYRYCFLTEIVEGKRTYTDSEIIPKHIRRNVCEQKSYNDVRELLMMLHLARLCQV